MADRTWQPAALSTASATGPPLLPGDQPGYPTFRAN